MDVFNSAEGGHKLVTVALPGRPVIRILCQVRPTAEGRDHYYVLAECEGRALKWRSLVRDNAVLRLKDEIVTFIAEAEDLDDFDVETILLCTTEPTTA